MGLKSPHGLNRVYVGGLGGWEETSDGIASSLAGVLFNTFPSYNLMWQVPYFHLLDLLFFAGQFRSKLFSQLLKTVDIKPKSFTAATTNTRPRRVFYWVQTSVLVDVNKPLSYHGFSRVGLERILFRKNMSAFKPFLQYFAIGYDTASCQDYEENEFVECLSQETQIIDIFTHCKLQPRINKFSQYTLTARLSSC